MRLQKYIAHSGITSRRKAEELIKQGRVKVNDKVVTNMGIVIDPSKDAVYIDRQRIYLEKKKIYIMLNKPEGYVTTLSDERNRPTVMDLVQDIPERIYPVGRLDYDTSGLLLLTNDGQLAFRLTHPKHEIPKTYIAKIKGMPNTKELKKFKKGINIDGYVTAPAKIELLRKETDSCIVKVIIHEGKNRQIRKMFNAILHPVLSLKRVAVGRIHLNELPKGSWRYLSQKEINYLKKL